MYTTRQGSRASCVAQTGFAAFGKGVQLISGSPYAETKQLSRATSSPQPPKSKLLPIPTYCFKKLLKKVEENTKKWIIGRLLKLPTYFLKPLIIGRPRDPFTASYRNALYAETRVFSFVLKKGRKKAKKKNEKRTF